MDHVDGLVLHDSVVGQEVVETDRRTLGLHVMDVLSNLHKINPDDVGLGELGRKEAYLARQLKRWNKQWVATKTHPVPEMEESAKLLEERMPDQVGATIVHGDYRLGNMIVESGEIQAVLDWELCTLGDPLADVGYLLNNWVSPEEVEAMEGDSAPTAVGGYPSRDELCDIYATNTGRDLSEINYYRAFSHWRLAAIGQGVYKRYLVGAMGEDRDMDLEKYKESVTNRAAQALALLTA
jgi:aminoglycoside phosphotransferase (APT) family kinase protein